MEGLNSSFLAESRCGFDPQRAEGRYIAGDETDRAQSDTLGASERELERAA